MSYVERLHELAVDCLFRPEEIFNGERPANAVVVQGIVTDFGFHPERLQSKRDAILALARELVSPEFDRETHGGHTFLLLPFVRDTREQWGEHTHAETLFCLCQALGVAGYCVPIDKRDLWAIFPGGLPYVWFDLGKTD